MLIVKAPRGGIALRSLVWRVAVDQSAPRDCHFVIANCLPVNTFQGWHLSKYVPCGFGDIVTALDVMTTIAAIEEPPVIGANEAYPAYEFVGVTAITGMVGAANVVVEVALDPERGTPAATAQEQQPWVELELEFEPWPEA